MILLKKLHLVLGLLFTINFVYSLFDHHDTHKLLVWEVDILIYRIYSFVIALVFIRLYLKVKSETSKNE
jgi:hypothetical protein